MTLIAAAQSCAHPADLPRNLDDHLRLMRIAQARGVRLLVFPELSLTGYEPTAAAALAQPADTPLLQPLRQLAEQARMTTVVGLPLRSPKHAKPLIAALILGADGSLGVYAKQHLHAGEERHFSAGDGGPLLEIDGLPMALAVCADFSQPSHPAHAARAGARLRADRRKRLPGRLGPTGRLCPRARNGRAAGQPWRADGRLEGGGQECVLE